MTDRRTFIKSMTALAASTAFLGNNADAKESQALKHPHGLNSKLRVDYEWGKLEEVVVGYPFLRLGGLMPKAVENFHRPSPEMMELMQKWLATNPNMPLDEFAPELWATQNDQMNAAIKILRNHGIKVHQVERFNAAELEFEENIGPAALQQFPRDPILVIGDQIFELPLHMPYRRKERFPIRRTLTKRLIEFHATLGSSPEPYPYPEGNNGDFGPSAFLEGGDVLLFGKNIFVGNTGNASNKAGIAWLQSQLGNSYRVHEVPLSKDFLHLDCVLCTPRPGLAIICREAFINGIPDYFKGWELIDVPAEDAETKLACNGLILDQKSIIIGTETPYIGERLTKAGMNVYTTPFDAMAALGGAFRCWHHPLVRSN